MAVTRDFVNAVTEWNQDEEFRGGGVLEHRLDGQAADAAMLCASTDEDRGLRAVG